MTVLAFDFGRRFIGVAVGEEQIGIANPLTTIDSEASEARFAAIAALIARMAGRRCWWSGCRFRCLARRMN